ncbi:MAG: hypothetical protein FJZ59_06370 [Chlamydiae bacterium]|nr:hypothetical protein [Chlamydiota bacterium]
MLFSLLFSSCIHYIQVAKVEVNQSNLASTFVRSPDPKQDHPPTGEKLFVTWQIPLSIDPSNCQIVLSLIYKDLTEETKTYPLSHRIGRISFPLLDEKFKETKGLFAYQALLVDKDNKVIDKWEHQMWVKVIH